MRLRVPALALLVLAILAPPTGAVSPIPDEAALRLPGDRVRAAMVGDVDGDGIRELVRLLPWDANPATQAVEVFSVRGGDPIADGQAPLWRAATPDDTFAGRRPNADNLLRLGVSEPARLIAWRLDGREQVLAATIGTEGLARPCCLTLWRVSVIDRRTSADLLQGGSISAASILAADLDDDGTDELVVVETPSPEMAPIDVRRVVVVLRWNGEAFNELRAVVGPSASSGPPVPLGDSDGLPGDEVGLVGVPRFDQLTPTLVRIALTAEGEVSVEHAQLPDDGEIAPFVVDGAGRLALVASTTVSLLDWPAGSIEPLVEATSPRGGELLGVLGEDLETRILVLRGGAVDVLDTALTSQQGITVGIAATQFAFSDLPPYAGPLPGGGPDREPTLLFGGRLLTANLLRPALSLLATGDAAVLPGRSPVGLFGPGGSWAVVALADTAVGGRRGGLLDAVGPDPIRRMWMIPSSALFSGEEDAGAIAPALVGAVVDVTRRIPTLLTTGRITAKITAPTGSTVRAIADGAGETQRNEVVIPSLGLASLELLDASGSDVSSFNVLLQVITPAGHGYAARWQVRVVREPPQLSVETPQAAWGLEVTLIGRTAPGASVQVDGEPAAVGPDGSFSAPVSAGLLPRSVMVSATDLLGNRAEARVEVVAPIDYRRLPWVPIAVGFTLLTAVVLVLRSPRPARREMDGAGTLEELE